MSSVNELDHYKKRLKEGLQALNTMQKKLEESERWLNEPIAVVGLGCRFPGKVASPETYWQLLTDGVDAIQEVPAARWNIDEFYDPDPEKSGKMYTRFGGFLEDIDKFDAKFFGISPREAASMDPQQRLILEVSWEALEHAGVAADRLKGTQTGVFVGVGVNEYGNLMRKQPVDHADAYFGTGNSPSVIAGRISYILGLQGPCMSIDTACSSSLVAVHLACQSLRQQECDRALAGGVNVLLSPYTNVILCKARMLAADGRCKTFDAGADGYVRSDGCGVVVLRRLSDALRDNDQILAVIRGSAVSQDGHSSGLTVPNAQAQEALIRTSLKRAKTEPAQISYLEAHGTGTSLGDPIEVRALGKVFSQDRPAERALTIGSVKTNIGHLEAAAGIAGLIKTVLALYHKTIPAHLHLQTINPDITLDNIPAVVPTGTQPWAAWDTPRRAGVSSFGFSGILAHAVLEEAPPSPVRPAETRRPIHVLTLSARSSTALDAQVRQMTTFLDEQPENALADICYSANTGRARLPHRILVTGSSKQQVVKRLAVSSSGKVSEGVQYAELRSDDRPKLAFLFSGQGAQYVQMGRQLYETQAVFRDTVDQCHDILSTTCGLDLRQALYPDNGRSELDQTAFTQPAMFALECALAELWRSWGIVPDVVLGHSIGEFAAACVAGFLTLSEGLELVTERGRLMGGLPQDGAMAVIFADEAFVRKAIADFESSVSIGAINAPDNIVISGDRSAVDSILLDCEKADIQTRRLVVSHAFHSPLMEPILDDLAAAVERVHFSEGEIPLISNLSGRLVQDGEIQQSDYWRRHAREAVQFSAGMHTLEQLGIDAFVEIGPGTTLLGMGRKCIPARECRWMPSLRKGRSDWDQMIQTVSSLVELGADFDWEGFDRGACRRRVALPTYPFQRKRYWLDGGAAVAADEPGDNLMTTPKTASAPGAQRFGDWLYEVNWVVKPAEEEAQTDHDRDGWLIFADQSGVGTGLASILKERGQHVSLVTAGEKFHDHGDGRIEINPANASDFSRAIDQQTKAELKSLRGVIYLWPLDTPSVEAGATLSWQLAQRLCCNSVLHLLQQNQTLVEDPAFRMIFVTQGSQSTGENDTVGKPWQAMLWGLAKVLFLESPNLNGCIIDLPATDSQDVLSQLADEAIANSGERFLAIRGGKLLAARLGRARSIESSSLTLNPAGCYLITGGFGSLGLHVAESMVQAGARHLVLMGRHGADKKAAKKIKMFSEQKVQITELRGDVGQREDLAELFAGFGKTLPGLKGIVHAAGVLDDGVLQNQTSERFARVLAPKVAGAWNLHDLSQDFDLDFFIVFSSAASLLGSAGQSNYAAANAFLDALVHHRMAKGLPALSINWGPWGNTGMAADTDSRRQRQRQNAGLRSIAPNDAVQVFQLLLQAKGHTQVGVMDIDWAKLQTLLAGKQWPSLLKSIAEEVAVPHESPESRLSPLDEFRQTAADKREGMVESYVRTRLGLILTMAPAEIGPEDSIFELGVDSLMAMELANYLQKDFDYKLSVREVHRRPTVGALAKYLTLAFNRREGAGTGETQTTQPKLTVWTRKGKAQVPLPPEKRNSSMLFLLSCPRSGSTLLRVMLAGHPDLFSPPELHLLPFDTLREWQDALSLTVLGEGLQRAFMELKQLDVTESKRLIEELAGQDTSVHSVYKMLQELAGQRLLVDKSPSYSSEREILERAELLFEKPKYLFLYRHPYSVVESYLRNEMGTINLDDGGDRQSHAELVWSNGNSNIADFLEGIDKDRAHFVCYEKLVKSPEGEMRNLCNFLDLPYHEALIHPYAGDRMTNGVRADVLSIGDPNFLKHKEIDPALGDAWRKITLQHRVSGFTKRVALELGYELPSEMPRMQEPGQGANGTLRIPPLKKYPRADNIPLSFAQQRLWFLDQFQPGNPMYNIPKALWIKGKLDIEVLHRCLREIVRRHESLRTTFSAIDGQPVQVIAPGEAVEMKQIDLTRVPEEKVESEALRLAKAEIRRPFDLTKGPLFRSVLIRLRPEHYLLLMPMHHIVTDGWSLGIINRELEALYAAFVDNQPSPLPAPSLHYADYSQWQTEWLRGQNLEIQLDYWRKSIDENPPSLNLSTDRPRPAVLSANGDRRYFDWPQGLRKKLRALARQEGLTLYMTLLAAFKALLYRYTGQTHIVVGSPIANRDKPGLENIVGFFVNNLVLRTAVTGELTFRELLHRVKEVALGAFAHQDMPFEQLVNTLQTERDPSRSPLFQVMFVLQNFSMAPPKMSGLEVQASQVHSNTAKYDLRLSMYETEDEALKGNMEYNTDLFREATIDRMLGHLHCLVRAVVEKPDLKLEDVTILPDTERRQILTSWNSTRQTFTGSPVLLHKMFEKQARKSPDAIAVSIGDSSLTYRELNLRANRLAHYLKTIGIEPESRVGICMDRSLDMPVALLGVLKSGAAYVPIDPSFPKARLAMMFEDAELAALLTRSSLTERVSDKVKTVICVDTEWEKVEKSKNTQLRTAVTADNLAYIIFTSGSTGRPKGVQIEHGAVTNFLKSMTKVPGMRASDRLLAVTTLSFDISLLEIFLPLVNGAQVVLAPSEVTSDGPRLLKLIQQARPTVMQATPATWRMLLDCGLKKTANLKALCGGEALAPDLAQKILERCDSLWNMYGPTEATVWALVHGVDSVNGSVPIGTPIANTSAYIVDKKLQPVPVGIAGELLLGGQGLARGYLKSPDLTAEKFIMNSIEEPVENRLYRTGDLAKYRPDGTIEFLGRIDQQVKVRGFRIELAEIEDSLIDNTGVQEAVVVARPDKSGENQLAAYLVCAENGEPDTSALRKALAHKLPDYMIPTTWVVLEELPLTPNGKVDRKALPEPQQGRRQKGRKYIGPQTDIEKTVAQVWQDVLDVDKVARNDRFFELGGHSLLATQVVARLERQFKIKLPVRAIFEAKTVAELATRIEGIRGANGSSRSKSAEKMMEEIVI